MIHATSYIVLFLVATAVAVVTRRWGVPYAVGLVVAGLFLGAIHALPAPHLTKELLFTVFLPGLLFEAAFHIDFSEFWKDKVALVALAVPGVVISLALTALIVAPATVALGLGRGFAWQSAVVFGALIAATDPIAVVSLFRRLEAPRRLSMLVEGESLLNDGTSIVLFGLALSFVLGETTSPAALVFDFFKIVGMGALLGLAAGWAVSQAIRRVDDPMVEISLTTIAAYGTFVVADRLGFSGVIATVSAGMVCGNYGTRVGMSPTTRVAVESFWEYVAFALNSFVFLLIGFEVQLQALLASWWVILLAFMAVMLGRAVVVAGVAGLLSRGARKIPPSWAAILTWGGLRGGLSMVLALGLPSNFPNRELVINMTIGVVTMTILLNGLTMHSLLKRLRVSGPHEESAGGEERIEGRP